ncbi:hypothetical protein AU198_14940 [Mycobacterium sp. GA-1199]|uniref:hypothetical protein n=1 Tax=Mycobacterium sp. GA-1199 TaxID=1772287 RepID=UPI0007470A4B|nr:hypothetical protein [Mycobacterium sp. GA-1199]KUI44815.1 hypothetical protein AU198_14940 [Mycobacterium sp. GA-1199]
MDDGVQQLMRAMDAEFPDVETMSAPQAWKILAGRRPPVPNLDYVTAADDRLIPGQNVDVSVRVYRPHGVAVFAPRW